MSEDSAVFQAAYKVAYEAALEAANAAYGYNSIPVGASNEDTLELNFKKLWDALRNHWIFITALTLLFAVLGFVYSQFLVTPQYQASVNLIVLTNNADTPNQSVSNEYVNSAKNLAKTYAQILNSSMIQNDVIEDLGLEYSYSQLHSMVKAEPLTDSQVVKVTVTTDSASMSRDIADAFMRIAPGDLNDIVEAGRCDTVSEVDVKSNPIKPGMKRTVGLMAIIGFAFGFAYALFRELQNHYLITSTDIKDILDLPVLGVIPEPAAIR